MCRLRIAALRVLTLTFDIMLILSFVQKEHWIINTRLKQSAYAMSADLDLSTPEVPEPTFLESVLRYGLFLGAIFQLICILAVIVIPSSKGNEQVRAIAHEGKVLFIVKLKDI